MPRVPSIPHSWMMEHVFCDVATSLILAPLVSIELRGDMSATLSLTNTRHNAREASKMQVIPSKIHSYFVLRTSRLPDQDSLGTPACGVERVKCHISITTPGFDILAVLCGSGISSYYFSGFSPSTMRSSTTTSAKVGHP